MHPKIAPPLQKRLTREERRQQTVNFLRQAALGEFASSGVAGTSAERIAEAAGFTRGAFYANFENKRALLLDLIREKLSTELGIWQTLTERPWDLQDLFEILNRRALDFDPQGVWALVGQEINLYAQRDPKFAAQYRQYHDQICGSLQTILEGLFRQAGKQLPMDMGELADALMTLQRSPRLPAPEAGAAKHRPFSPDMMILILRGLMAIAPPVNEPT
ncbi:MAG: TetR family transcriptional regulator [Rhodocyclaceae bacterium]|jgi:AcrR family transcriptional regulator|nr:TetR family transcriptional regulator [Rhodocyclaceae bacterium]